MNLRTASVAPWTVSISVLFSDGNRIDMMEILKVFSGTYVIWLSLFSDIVAHVLETLTISQWHVSQYLKLDSMVSPYQISSSERRYKKYLDGRSSCIKSRNTSISIQGKRNA